MKKLFGIKKDIFQRAVFSAMALLTFGYISSSQGQTNNNFCVRLEGVRTPCIAYPPAAPPPGPAPGPSSSGCTTDADCGNMTCYSGGTSISVTVASTTGGECTQYAQNCTSGEQGVVCTQGGCIATAPITCSESTVTCSTGGAASSVAQSCSNGSCVGSCPSGSSSGGAGCPAASSCD